VEVEAAGRRKPLGFERKFPLDTAFPQRGKERGTTAIPELHFGSSRYSEVENTMEDALWYRNGLRFACAQCGRCCGGGPGTIRANDEEITALAARLDLDDAAFRRRYTRKLRNGDISLIEKDNHDCIFYDRKRGCTVYAQRPRQCRTWPFWRSIVFSPETWTEGAKSCRGMNFGLLHGHDEIAALASNDGTSASRRRRAAKKRNGGKAAEYPIERPPSP